MRLDYFLGAAVLFSLIFGIFLTAFGGNVCEYQRLYPDSFQSHDDDLFDDVVGDLGSCGQVLTDGGVRGIDETRSSIEDDIISGDLNEDNPSEGMFKRSFKTIKRPFAATTYMSNVTMTIAMRSGVIDPRITAAVTLILAVLVLFTIVYLVLRILP